MVEFLIDCLSLICLRRFSILKEINDISTLEEEKKFIKIIFQYFDFYLNSQEIAKKNSIIKNIIVNFCFFVNYEREFSWKLMKSFLETENKIVKYFLDVIYNESLIHSYKGLDDYFYFDSDDEFGLTSYFDKIYFFENLYKIFQFKLGDFNLILVKNQVKIIKGAIYFIVMTLWSYERITKIYIPNTIVLAKLYKLVTSSNRKIDQEVILCLRRLVTKYGETLTDEWKEIFKIINLIITKEKIQSDKTLKNLYEIMDSIKLLIISNKFFGLIESFSNLLDEFKLLFNDSLIIIKTKLKLSNSVTFVSKLEGLIVEYLAK